MVSFLLLRPLARAELIGTHDHARHSAWFDQTPQNWLE
jgi:hypothetical protein